MGDAGSGYNVGMSTTHKSADGTEAAEPVVGGRITLQTLREMKTRRQPIAMLTCYDHPTAKILAKTGVNILLVGDSAATTVLGAESTVKATFDFLLTLTEAVRRGAPDVFLMADMPFASYPDVPTAVGNAGAVFEEAGADAVKLEADIRHAEIVTRWSAAGGDGVCACGVAAAAGGAAGGVCGAGAGRRGARRLIEETVAALANAEAHLLLVEAVPDEVTAEIVRQVVCPVLGCGAGPSADGHVVVLNDMLGQYSGARCRGLWRSWRMCRG